jgi:hypothetical protein
MKIKVFLILLISGFLIIFQIWLRVKINSSQNTQEIETINTSSVYLEKEENLSTTVPTKKPITTPTSTIEEYGGFVDDDEIDWSLPNPIE